MPAFCIDGGRMALIIENGTGVAGADSFVTVAEYEAFKLSYFGDAVAGETVATEAALRRAWFYMAALRWKSGLWPTFGGAVPENVKRAQSVFARAEYTATGSLSPAVTLAGQTALTGVDSIKWQVIGGDATVENSRPVVTAGFDFLRGLLDYDPASGIAGYTGIMVA